MTFAFTDINEKNLDGITQLARRDIESNKLSVRIVSTGDRREGVAGADYVINNHANRRSRGVFSGKVESMC